jgi:hypothetical protein
MYIFNPWNEDTSIIRTVLSGPKVSGIEGFLHTPYVGMMRKPNGRIEILACIIAPIVSIVHKSSIRNREHMADGLPSIGMVGQTICTGTRTVESPNKGHFGESFCKEDVLFGRFKCMGTIQGENIQGPTAVSFVGRVSVSRSVHCARFHCSYFWGSTRVQHYKCNIQFTLK